MTDSEVGRDTKADEGAESVSDAAPPSSDLSTLPSDSLATSTTDEYAPYRTGSLTGPPANINDDAETMTATSTASSPRSHFSDDTIDLIPSEPLSLTTEAPPTTVPILREDTASPPPAYSLHQPDDSIWPTTAPASAALRAEEVEEIQREYHHEGQLVGSPMPIGMATTMVVRDGRRRGAGRGGRRHQGNQPQNNQLFFQRFGMQEQHQGYGTLVQVVNNNHYGPTPAPGTGALIRVPADGSEAERQPLRQRQGARRVKGFNGKGPLVCRCCCCACPCTKLTLVIILLFVVATVLTCGAMGSAVEVPNIGKPTKPNKPNKPGKPDKPDKPDFPAWPPWPAWPEWPEFPEFPNLPDWHDLLDWLDWHYPPSHREGRGQDEVHIT